MSNSGIYKIENVANGKFYIGSAVNFVNRFYGHKAHLRHGKHCNPRLQNAWNKYGEKVFIFNILEHVPEKEKLIEREQYWLDHLKAVERGYNVTPTAGSQLGYRHTEETKKKIAKTNTGSKRTQETKQRMSAWQIGKKVSQETRSKIGLANRGRKITQKQIESIRKAHIGTRHSEETKTKMSLAKKGYVFTEAHKAALKKGYKLRIFKKNAKDIAWCAL